MELKELKRCPFCKLDDLTIQVSGVGEMKIVCNSCGASGPVTEIEGIGSLEYWINEAISDWNDRAD